MADNRFWRWYDRGSRVDFGGTLLGLVFDWRTWLFSAGGGVLSVFTAAYDGWSVTACLFAFAGGLGAFALLAAGALMLWRGIQGGRAPERATVPPERDFSNEMRSNIYQKLERLLPEAKRALYRVATAEIEADQINVEMKGELQRAGFVKPGVGYAPAEFIERYRPFILQWFREQTRPLLSISDPYLVKDTGLGASWKVGIHNVGASAASVHLNLCKIDPPPKSRYLPADYPYRLVQSGLTLDSNECQINQGGAAVFEITKIWTAAHDTGRL
jgi:hypothetical protein